MEMSAPAFVSAHFQRKLQETKVRRLISRGNAQKQKCGGSFPVEMPRNKSVFGFGKKEIGRNKSESAHFQRQ